MSITITGGKFTSDNQSSFYEGSSRDVNSKKYQYGSALKKVAISGGTFTTKNTTLSVITIQNSGDTINITNGISIKDEAGNNLLYRGVNLIYSSSNYNAKWGGDNTSCYTLELMCGGNYKLMDAIKTTGTGIKINANNVILDGNWKKITTTGTVAIDVVTSKTGTVIQNMDITSSGTTDTNNLVVLSSPTLLKDSVFDFTNYKNSGSQAMNGIYVYGTSAKDSQILNNTIKNGDSKTARSQAIVVHDAENVTIKGNTITPGKQADSTSKDNESIGIRLYGDAKSAKIINNTIISSQNDRPNIGLLIDVKGTDSSATSHLIWRNTFSLAETPGTAIIELVPKVDSAVLSLDMSDNIIDVAKHGIYVNFTDKTNGPITLIGTIYNNFSKVTGSFFANDSATSPNTKYTFTDNTKWNTTATTSFGTHKKIVDGQTHLAGNWWGVWSENRKSTTGYMTFADAAAAQAAGLPVADLAPLVKVGQAATFKIETGLPSGNALNLSNASQKTGTFTVTPATAVTWESSNQSVMTIDSSAGTYMAIAVGNTTITATSASDPTLTATVLVTVFEPVKADNATKSVTKMEIKPPSRPTMQVTLH